MPAGVYDYIIAFATAIVFGKKSQDSSAKYHRKRLDQGHITMFPFKRMKQRAEIKTTKLVSAYCTFRMPEHPKCNCFYLLCVCVLLYLMTGFAHLYHTCSFVYILKIFLEGGWR